MLANLDFQHRSLRALLLRANRTFVDELSGWSSCDGRGTGPSRLEVLEGLPADADWASSVVGRPDSTEDHDGQVLAIADLAIEKSLPQGREELLDRSVVARGRDKSDCFDRTPRRAVRC